MYLLPEELIIKIYEYDSTYREKYNEIIKTINFFPKFDFYIGACEFYVCHYIKKYNFLTIEIEDKFYCKEKYKKAYIIVAKAISKPNTFKVF